jgi:hypothetical protein
VLVDELEKARQRDIAAALDAGERRVAETLGRLIEPAQVELTDHVRTRFAEFAKWAGEQSVRACAAKPATVAMWVLSHRDLGAHSIMDMLAAVEAVHNYHGLSVPTKSAIVCRALEALFKSEPPRSWPAADKLLFATLPETIKQIIGRRERDRERELRRAQNLAAELKRNSQPDTAQPVEQKEKESTHGQT